MEYSVRLSAQKPFFFLLAAEQEGGMATDFLQLINSVGQAYATDAFCSVVVFPKTESLAQDQPKVSWRYPEDVSSFQDAAYKATTCTELIALNAVKDVQMAMQVIVLPGPVIVWRPCRWTSLTPYKCTAAA
jgi:hypothetical protein